MRKDFTKKLKSKETSYERQSNYACYITLQNKITEMPLYLVTAGEKIFQKKLIFGDPLNWFDKVSCYGVLQAKTSLKALKVGPTMGH